MSDFGSSSTSGATAGATLTAFFDSRSDAESAMSQLRSVGVSDSSMRVTGGEETTSSSATTREDKGFFEALGDLFMPDDDRHTYAEGLSRGGYLLTVNDLSPDMQDTALDVLENAGAIDIDEREQSWRAEGWSGYQGRETAGYASGAGTATGVSGAAGFAEERTTLSEGETVPVVEEQLRVGKRDTSLGRVRVRSYVRETPVSEQVELTSERVEIERRPVDRPLSAGDDAFRERTIEAEERSEEAVVSKEARVVEEIGLRRERESHSETISDTVRHTEVEVDDERTGGTTDTTRDTDRR